MRTIRIAFVSAFAALFCVGCASDNHTPDNGDDRPYVVMNGSLETVEQTPSRSAIDPRDADGLPNAPLTVGIMTLNYTTSDPTTDKPNEVAWMSSTANLSRGYFGGPGVNAPVVENGEINYTNETGSAIRKLFYDEGGEYYFTRVVYPFVASREDQTRIANPNHVAGKPKIKTRRFDGS